MKTFKSFLVESEHLHHKIIASHMIREKPDYKSMKYRVAGKKLHIHDEHHESTVHQSELDRHHKGTTVHHLAAHLEKHGASKAQRPKRRKGPGHSYSVYD